MTSRGAKPVNLRSVALTLTRFKVGGRCWAPYRLPGRRDGVKRCRLQQVLSALLSRLFCSKYWPQQTQSLVLLGLQVRVNCCKYKILYWIITVTIHLAVSVTCYDLSFRNSACVTLCWKVYSWDFVLDVHILHNFLLLFSFFLRLSEPSCAMFLFLFIVLPFTLQKVLLKCLKMSPFDVKTLPLWKCAVEVKLNGGLKKNVIVYFVLFHFCCSWLLFIFVCFWTMHIDS